MSSPFNPSTSRPGHGTIDLSLLPPSTPVLRTLSYQYPLKLIAPKPLAVSPTPDPNADSVLVHTVFLLTYGGGIIAGDTLDLSVLLAPTTRLILLTQGSTKIFKSPSREIVSAQRMSMSLAPGSALVYLPDPVQPFAQSAFEQRQVYELEGSGEGEEEASLCVCDWVCRGRGARGEDWDFFSYTSRNEVLGSASSTSKSQSRRRLLLRDNVILDTKGGGSGTGSMEIAGRMDGLGVFGTLIIRGPVFEGLGKYFMDEFGRLPRIGSRKWEGQSEDGDISDDEVGRKRRQRQEVTDGLLWTAASVRGFIVVKFGAREVEGVKRWLSCILKAEGSVERNFGERALHCLK